MHDPGASIRITDATPGLLLRSLVPIIYPMKFMLFRRSQAHVTLAYKLVHERDSVNLVRRMRSASKCPKGTRKKESRISRQGKIEQKLVSKSLYSLVLSTMVHHRQAQHDIESLDIRN